MLSNTATPKYYGMFREKVISGEIPVCNTVSMEMNRIDQLIANKGVYYDEDAVEGFIAFCEGELTLTDGSPLYLLDTFKLWAEQVYGWYYYVDKQVYVPGERGGHYERMRIKKRLIKKQYLIVGRGAAKSIYDSAIQSYELTANTTTKRQITTSPTMKQSDEVLQPIRTAMIRPRGPLFKFLTAGSLHNTTGSKLDRCKLAPTKDGIINHLTGSELTIRPMSIDRLQGLRPAVSTVDEWLSGDVREDVVGAIEQGASKMDDYLIIATSSEGTVRNGPGDTIKIELMKILKGEYNNPHVSIWWYRLDDVKEVNDPSMWVKANPNIGKTVSYEAYQLDVERAENAPSTRNDILAKRFGIPMEGFTYFFTYEETKVHRPRSFWGMRCSMGIDLSKGDDFCAFTWLFPLNDGRFGIKVRSYVTSRSMALLPTALRQKYEEFANEGTLIILEGSVLDMQEVYNDVDEYIQRCEYDVCCVGYDPYNANEFMSRYIKENGQYGVEKVIQGARTESVPLGELKNLASDRDLLFDESLMEFTMGNSIVIEDSNGNRKLSKMRRDAKIDNVSALMDAYVSYKLHKDDFD